jgi:carbamoyl-phosphate synthase large subunit
LYFEPLTLEHVLNIVWTEQPAGVIVQFGGQTPLKLAKALEGEGVSVVELCAEAGLCGSEAGHETSAPVPGTIR